MMKKAKRSVITLAAMVATLVTLVGCSETTNNPNMSVTEAKTEETTTATVETTAERENSCCCVCCEKDVTTEVATTEVAETTTVMTEITTESTTETTTETEITTVETTTEMDSTVTETTNQATPRKFKIPEDEEDYGRRAIYRNVFEKMKVYGGEFPYVLSIVNETRVFEASMSREELKEHLFDRPDIVFACETKNNEWVILMGWDEETGKVMVMTVDGEKEYPEASFGEEVKTLLPEA